MWLPLALSSTGYTAAAAAAKRSVEEELFTQSNPPPIRPAQAMSKIEERMEAGSLVLHSAELIRSWAVDWATELTTRSVRSMPALMLLGDVAGTAAVTGALRSYLIEGETSWVGSHPGVLELDTRRCPAADCTEQIEAFMVARSRGQEARPHHTLERRRLRALPRGDKREEAVCGEFGALGGYDGRPREVCGALHRREDRGGNNRLPSARV